MKLCCFGAMVFLVLATSLCMSKQPILLFKCLYKSGHLRMGKVWMFDSLESLSLAPLLFLLTAPTSPFQFLTLFQQASMQTSVILISHLVIEKHEFSKLD